MKSLVSVVFVVAIFVATPHADVWDFGLENDNSPLGTISELVHGSDEIHDLLALSILFGDEDYFRVGVKAGTSWEVIVDSTGIGLGNAAGLLTLVNNVGGILGTSLPVTTGLGHGRTLRFLNTTLVDDITRIVRVGNPSCGILCTALSQYRIRSRETTIGVPRFNNSSTQVTVLMTQNVSNEAVNATAFFYDGAGTRLHSQPYSIPSKGVNVMTLPTIPQLVGQSGSLMIAHDGVYGSLNVKTVALEPATGFSFDTPGTYKP